MVPPLRKLRFMSTHLNIRSLLQKQDKAIFQKAKQHDNQVIRVWRHCGSTVTAKKIIRGYDTTYAFAKRKPPKNRLAGIHILAPEIKGFLITAYYKLWPSLHLVYY